MRVYQWIAAWVILLTVLFGGIAGTYIYVRDQRDQSSREAAAATYVAARASYENARDERTRCEQRVASRDDIRGAFLGVYDLIDQLSPDNRFTATARDRLDATYPAVDLSDCPPEPTPPPALEIS